MAAAERLRICSIGSARSVAIRMRTRCLAARGHRVAMLTPEPVTMPGIEVLSPSAGHASGARRILSYLQMAAMLWRWRADVVVVHFAALPFSWLLPLIWFKPMAVSVMGGDILFHQRVELSPRRRRAALELLEISDRVISMSEYMIAAYPTLQKKSLITPWGIDFARFANVAGGDSPSDRAALGIAAETPVILSPRRLVPVCGVGTIVESMVHVRERLPGALLLLLDDGADPQYRRQIVATIDRLDLGANVKWLARADYASMPGLYRLADVTVSVARSDGVSLAVLESMAAGTPVVLGDIPNYAGVFADRVNCRSADPCDPRAIAAAIVEVLIDDELRALITDAARAKVAAVGDLARESERVEQMLIELVHDPHRPRRAARRLRHFLNLALLAFEPDDKR